MITIRFFKQSLRWLSDLTVGSSWGRTQSARTQRNLRSFWFDGLFSAASENIVNNFTSLYILSLGATQSQIGLMSSITNLGGAILLLPGALIAERAVSRKRVTVLTGGGFARLALLLLVFVPIFFKGNAVVWVAMALSVIRDALGNLGYPSWMSVTHDIVPIEGRGRFFAARNFAMGITGIVFTLLAGKLISLYVEPLGFQIALALAFVFGTFATFSYIQIIELNREKQNFAPPLLTLHTTLRLFSTHPEFTAIILCTALWNFAINITGPFFNVYLIQQLKFSTVVVGFLAVISQASSLFLQNKIGALTDRYGARRLQLISMCMIPLLPLGWTLASQVWHVVLINLFGGILWAVFNLAQFNLLLASMPKDQIPRFSAVYQIIITLALAAGAFAGSLLIKVWGFIAIFVVSALLRWIATGFFAHYVKPLNLSKHEE